MFLLWYNFHNFSRPGHKEHVWHQDTAEKWCLQVFGHLQNFQCFSLCLEFGDSRLLLVQFSDTHSCWCDYNYSTLLHLPVCRHLPVTLLSLVSFCQGGPHSWSGHHENRYRAEPPTCRWPVVWPCTRYIFTQPEEATVRTPMNNKSTV